MKRKAGRQFLVFPYDRGSVSIVDEDGNYYGSWMSWESFVKHEGWEQPVSKVRLSFVTIQPAL